MKAEEYFKKNKVKLSDRDKLAIKTGGLITYARLHAGITQTELARRIGTLQPSIARAEKGEVIASLEFLQKIAKATKLKFRLPEFIKEQ